MNICEPPRAKLDASGLYDDILLKVFPIGGSSNKITKTMIENMMEYQTCGQCTSSYRMIDTDLAHPTSGPGWTFANEEITIVTTETETVVFIQSFFSNSDCNTKVNTDPNINLLSIIAVVTSTTAL